VVYPRHIAAGLVVAAALSGTIMRLAVGDANSSIAPTTLPAAASTQPDPLMQRAVISDPGWEARFTKVYCLADDQVLKFVPFLSVSERNDYWERRLDYYTAKEHGVRDNSMPPHFEWEFFFFIPSSGRKVAIQTALVIHPIDSQKPGLDHLLKLLRQERFNTTDCVVLAPELDNLDLRGDWIVRQGVSQAKFLAALEQIIHEQTHRSVHFEKTDGNDRSYSAIEDTPPSPDEPGN
jgi:hypothetical protein